MFFGIWGSVVLRALLDPGADQCHIGCLQRGLALRHAGLAIFGRDHFQHGAFVGMGRINRRTFVLTTSEQFFEIGHHIATFRLRGLMTPLAVGLENRADLTVKAHLPVCGICGGNFFCSDAWHADIKRECK